MCEGVKEDLQSHLHANNKELQIEIHVTVLNIKLQSSNNNLVVERIHFQIENPAV